ncbi:MAG: (2Fe-2S)-binding protein [Rhodoplanes sp.]|uniref:(2Fe-2S)-binding protein n=1 Tax=Rhodoplanes sp. TaxID=1968906 RepID=UPI0017EF6664|nr:(2Fe-2S)-binding protein [Rhodoplanes sp.]NVO15268.1 (2Fe-2S)-binding protein [Rhodoplanes sp.]
MKQEIRFRLNSQDVTMSVEPNLTLLDMLREELQMTSAKRSCEQGECGACTVIMDGITVNACLVLAISVDGAHIETIESLGATTLHPLQVHFKDLAASQCGFCTPGMILSAKALLDRNTDPTEEDVKEGLAGNMCRCTGYVKPVQAVLAAAKDLREQAKQGWERSHEFR